MSLDERLDFEEGKIDSSDLYAKTCNRCKYRFNFLMQKVDYCHKCINNPRVPIKHHKGYSIEELYDYYKPMLPSFEKVLAYEKDKSSLPR